MKLPIEFIFKVFLVSTLLSCLIKYGGRLIIFSPNLVNALLLVFLPTLIMAIALSWRLTESK
jgi:hypothetical protein